ncbi:MAG: ribosome small subunit-dependent GTPase A [Clostridia bacterium]|nr:ribosome small subunit-dependent GTPase A [Clostridia bacterium]
MEKSHLRHGIITKGIGGLYGVRLVCEDGSITYAECRARGRFRHDGLSPLPGDDAVITEESVGDKTELVIDDILPRHSSLLRPPMANLTHLFLLVPACRPKPDLLTADKICAICEHSGVEVVIVAGKLDMDAESAENIRDIYTSAGYITFTLSAVTGEGTTPLMDYITRTADKCAADGRPMRAAFAGVSGAGKSTLMTLLFPDLSLATGNVSRKTERGRHTTRQVELFPLKSENGCEFYLADTPGFSMLDFTRYNFFPAGELAENFREFSECLGDCRYTKCTHTKEEGCAVREKLSEGRIHPSRHENYILIYDELKKKPEWKRQKEELSLPGRRKR